MTEDLLACDGDEPEVDSLVNHSELGRTIETVIELSARYVMGIADCRSDYAP